MMIMIITQKEEQILTITKFNNDNEDISTLLVWDERNTNINDKNMIMKTTLIK